MLPGVESRNYEMVNNFTWSVVSFSNYKMSIQLNFENPIFISSSGTRDALRITVIEPSFFQSEKTF